MKRIILATLLSFPGLLLASGIKYEAPASAGGGSGLLPLSEAATNYVQKVDTGSVINVGNSSITASQVTVNQNLKVPGGVPTAPAILFDGESNTGLIGDGGANPDAVGIVATGVLRYWQSASSAAIFTPTTISTLTVTSMTASGLTIAGTGVPTLAGSTSLYLSITGGGLTLGTTGVFLNNTQVSTQTGSYPLFYTTATAITQEGGFFRIFTGTVAASATVNVNSADIAGCPQIIMPIGLFAFNSAAVAAGELEIGTIAAPYSFGSPIPVVNRDATDVKAFVLTVICKP